MLRPLIRRAVEWNYRSARGQYLQARPFEAAHFAPRVVPAVCHECGQSAEVEVLRDCAWSLWCRRCCELLRSRDVPELPTVEKVAGVIP